MTSVQMLLRSSWNAVKEQTNILMKRGEGYYRETFSVSQSLRCLSHWVLERKQLFKTMLKFQGQGTVMSNSYVNLSPLALCAHTKRNGYNWDTNVLRCVTQERFWIFYLKICQDYVVKTWNRDKYEKNLKGRGYTTRQHCQNYLSPLTIEIYS